MVLDVFSRTEKIVLKFIFILKKKKRLFFREVFLKSVMENFVEKFSKRASMNFHGSWVYVKVTKTCKINEKWNHVSST